MKKIPVEELKPGMKFNKPVYIDSNNMFVSANVEINENDIKKLMKWGVTNIETAGLLISAGARFQPKNEINYNHIENSNADNIIRDYENLLKKRKSLIEVHKAACKAMEEIHNAIKNDKIFTTEKLEISLNKIIKLMQGNNNIFLFLYGLDEGKNYLMFHSINVTFYAILIGLALQFSSSKLRELGLGTLLIDAGMAKMPIYITHKQSNLTEQEFNLIKTHPLLGYTALQQLGKVKERISIVSLQHHEQYDGKGYPRGLKGNQINEYSRIASIADCYEAQIVQRSYRKKQLFYHAMKDLLASGVNKFDPVILRTFLSKMSVYPIGSLVQLNDGCIGLVIGSVPEKPLRPIIKLIFDKNQNKITKHIILNLLTETSLFITRALEENEKGINLYEIL